MNKGKNEIPLLGKILTKLAPKIGARVILEPEWNVVGQIIFKNGRKRYFKYSSLDLNPLGASEIAKDKDYANFFMQYLGYPTVPGRTFFSPEWAKAIKSSRTLDAAYRYAQKLGFPVLVKPNSGSQGKGVAFVYTKKELFAALRAIFVFDRVALVQRVLRGKDYRVVVLDDTVISAYQRIPLSVLGDGRHTIRQLLEKKQQDFFASSRDTELHIDNPRILRKLARSHMHIRSVPMKGVRVFLLDNANLSAGGDSIDVTRELHPEFEKIAITLTKDMGLRFCGVDFMVEGDITKSPEVYWILEINSAPGLDHYARTGRAQEKIVENLYLKVLKSLA